MYSNLLIKYSKPVFVTSSSEVYGKNVSDSLKESDDRILGCASYSALVI